MPRHEAKSVGAAAVASVAAVVVAAAAPEAVAAVDVAWPLKRQPCVWLETWQGGGAFV